MKVCIIGSGLTSLSLAKILADMRLNVDIFSDLNLKKIDKYRTLSISKNNLDFFNSNILNINRFVWKIYKIEIYSENLKNEKVLDFKNNQTELFSIIKNYKLFDQLIKEIKSNKLIKLKKNSQIKPQKLNDNYNLVINCDSKNLISKKYFYNKVSKNYNSFAYTTIINHKRLKDNNTATQIFTKKGPLAFLPISDEKTSVVYSIRNPKEINFENLIRKYNNKYSIIKVNHISKYELKSSNLRKYYNKNILAFGDMLHKLHPLAGQGFNMTIRDVKLLSELIKSRIENGLEIDSSICENFEKKIRHKNFLFANSIDFVYEFFHLESKFKNSLFSKSVQFIGKNKNLNNLITRFADDGLNI
tara:strand:+ start:5001 stop:6077 length:1077 start_codon:yes stop_codon:yes gene_type:complete